MVNPFPITWLVLFAYFILRVFVGLTLLNLGRKHWQGHKQISDTLADKKFPFPKFGTGILIITELIIGLMILIGFSTQYACLAGMVFSLKMMIFRTKISSDLIPTRYFYFLLLGSFCSLFITGAGAFAFDLPF